MTPRFNDFSTRKLFGATTLALILILGLLLLFAPPDGNERTQWLQFIGRFHPPSVHLPIALLVLVPLLELVGRRRQFSYLLPAANFVLVIATLGAIMAASLGWCLARNGGYSGPLVKQHMWAGVMVAAAAWLCWMLRARQPMGGSNRLYIATLVAAVALVSFTGYRGGQLSQGENHLTEFMPEPLARVMGINAVDDAPGNSLNGGPSTFFGSRIQPIFAAHCVTCHGRSKHKSNLRLDSYEAVMRGGRHGAVIRAGESKTSDLLRRVTLPASDYDVMPPDNRRLLSASDTRLIERWIASGASGTASADSIKEAPSTLPNRPSAEVTFEEIDPAAVAKQREALAPVVVQLQRRFPNILDYQSRSSADIVVSASWMGPKFGDNELSALAPLSERIVVADFSNTAITDHSAGTIAAMKHLRALRLAHTKITDTSLQALGSMDQLESLSFFDTSATPAALSALTRLTKLRHVYAGETKIAADTSVPMELKDKLIF